MDPNSSDESLHLDLCLKQEKKKNYKVKKHMLSLRHILYRQALLSDVISQVSISQSQVLIREFY